MQINQNQIKPKPKFSARTIVCFLILLFLILGFVSGLATDRLFFADENDNQDNQISGQVENINEKENPDFLGEDVDFQQFWQVWKYVKNNYVDSEIPDTKLFYGALAGVVASLEDPYSVFLNPEISDKFEEELSGSFEGIGAEIGIKDDRLTIIAPLPGTPADKAGLRQGDKVLAVDGYNTTGIALDYAVNIIRGEKGTEVVLTVLSEGETEPHDVSIIRDTIKIESVVYSRKDLNGKSEEDEGFVMKDGNIAYIEIRYFNENTLSDWDKIVQKVLNLNPKGIILDLRNNPGGFLNTAIEVTGEWVDGSPVVLERLRDGSQVAYRANRQAHFDSIPTVVLVNGGSASGSEIVSGALQDYQVATIIGETTFGKGSVQDLRKFSDGSSVKLTIAEWLTPLGRNINKDGIKPDIEIELTKEDYDNDKDPQLDKAIEILRLKK